MRAIRKNASVRRVARALAAAVLVLGATAPTAPAQPAALARAILPLPAAVGMQRLQTLLQAFADRAYLKSFRHLGDERDFDHGHFLFASEAPDAAPVAILYHTQELAFYAEPRSDYGWIDPEGRNWIQWLADGRVENASRYQRSRPPRGLGMDLEQLKRHRTILADMLEPSAFGGTRLSSRQIVFTKSSCPKAGPAADGSLQIRLKSERVCLSLSEY